MTLNISQKDDDPAGEPRRRHALRKHLIESIQDLENLAHRLGMTITGHALNNAKNAAGWELAGEAELAGMAALGGRAGAAS